LALLLLAAISIISVTSRGWGDTALALNDNATTNTAKDTTKTTTNTNTNTNANTNTNTTNNTTPSLPAVSSTVDSFEDFFRISPSKSNPDLTPGQHYSSDIKVTNGGTNTVTVKVYAQPYQVVGQDYIADFNTTNNYTQITDWLKFSQERFELSSKQSLTITYTVTVPTDVPAGGQYAVVFFETTTAQDDGQIINQASRIGHVIYASIDQGQTRLEGHLDSNLIPIWLFNPPIKASSTIKNTGNVDFTATYNLSVKTLLGDEVYHTNQDYTILPETTRLITQQWTDSPRLGLYKVEQTIDFLGQAHTTWRLVLTIPLAFMIAAIVVLAGIGLWVGMRLKGRR
jgi:hypothetical protein